MDDRELLRQYAVDASHEAFAQLVARHVNLVYSSALRQLRDRHLAEDATQAAFATLARKARAQSLRNEMVPAAWLLRCVRLECRDMLKRQARRLRHERAKAAQSPDLMSAMTQLDQAAWGELSLLLDDALDWLNENDRRAVVLRFFQDRPDSESAAVMGVTENAFRQRVFRALERLRKIFAHNGVMLSAEVLSAAMLTHAVHPAPAGLSSAVAGSAVSAAATASSSGGGVATAVFGFGNPKMVMALGTVIVMLATGVLALTKFAWGRPGSAAPTRIVSRPNSIVLSWKQAFDQTYRLNDNEVFKRIPPPYIPARGEWIATTTQFPVSGADAIELLLGWDGNVVRTLWINGGPGTLESVLGDVQTNLRAVAMPASAADARLLTIPLPGDLLVRQSASDTARLAALQEHVRFTTGRPVHIEKQQETRNVVVVRGDYTLRRAPNAPGRNGVYFSATTRPARGPYRRGTLEMMFHELGFFSGGDFVLEVAQPGQNVQWFVDPALQGAPALKPGEREALLKSVAGQTGLTLTPGRRPIDVVRVWEEAGP